MFVVPLVLVAFAFWLYGWDAMFVFTADVVVAACGSDGHWCSWWWQKQRHPGLSHTYPGSSYFGMLFFGMISGIWFFLTINIRSFIQRCTTPSDPSRPGVLLMLRFFGEWIMACRWL
jgi:hypothetical protein